MGYILLIVGYIGALTNLLTIDPNFHQDIQVVVYQGTSWNFAARGQELLVTGAVWISYRPPQGEPKDKQ